MEYKLRKVRDTDFDFIYQVKKRSIHDYVHSIWGWNEDYQQNDFKHDFNLNDFKVIVVKQEDVGFIQTHQFQNHMHITEIHILPNYQGNHIGSRIIQQIILDAKRSHNILHIGCFKQNQRAKALYERFGFKLTETTDTHYLFELNFGR